MLSAPATRRWPAVRHNDYSSLGPPALGQWTPTRSVSVVIPAYRAAATLPIVLAALAEQTYPIELTEIVVVDDGDSSHALELPARLAGRIRTVPGGGGWGPGAARATGAEAARGDVLLWLDADTVPFPEHLEAHLRWHHLVPYAAVLGQKWFVDPASLGARRTGAGWVEQLGVADRASEHDWIEGVLAATDDLRRAGARAFEVVVGASLSVSRELYQRAGGFDPELHLGEDSELGYRLAQAGAVIVPEREARCWHVGASLVQRRREQVNRYTAPFLAERVPLLRWRRTPGRAYLVPLVEVVVDAGAAIATGDYEAVATTVEAVLAGSLADVRCLIVDPAGPPPAERHALLDHPRATAGMVRAAFAGEPRVRIVTEAPRSAFPVPFRVELPAGVSVAPSALRRIVEQLAGNEAGWLEIVAGGRTITATRTAARERARWIGATPDGERAAVAAMFGERRVGRHRVHVGWPWGARRSLGATVRRAARRTFKPLYLSARAVPGVTSLGAWVRRRFYR